MDMDNEVWTEAIHPFWIGMQEPLTATIFCCGIYLISFLVLLGIGMLMGSPAWFFIVLWFGPIIVFFITIGIINTILWWKFG